MIPVTSLVFGNFYFDYYTYKFGLEFKLDLGLGLGLRLVFLGFISKCLCEWNIHRSVVEWIERLVLKQ